MSLFLCQPQADANRAICVTSVTISGGPDSQTLSQRGARAGDWVFAVLEDASYTVALSGGGSFSGGSRYKYIQLTAAMLSSKVGCTDSGGFYTEVTYAIYRGFNSITSVVTDSGNGPSRTKAGFTKNANHAGIIAVQTSSSGLTAPTLFSSRSYLAGRDALLQDRLAAGAPDYVSGTSFTWGASASGSPTLTVLELRY